MCKEIPVGINTSENYKVVIGENLIKKTTEFITSNFGNDKLFIIIDEQVYRNHNEKIEAQLGESFSKILKYVIPSGEASKSIEQYTSVVDFILKNEVERQTPLLAIGGGVVGDLAGFVAASVLRGIPLIHMPTTLLAMVDSSIGGKTGVNHDVGKNLIGAFYQPKAVFADVNFLNTLPHKEWVSGLSEVIKYGFIDSPEIFEELKKLTGNGEFASPNEWISVIQKSVQIKADIVSKDVKESGSREFLNFGHTFAHVIERVGNYDSYSHGEAVFAGMYAAVFLSNKMNANIDTTNLSSFRSLYDFSLKKISTDIDKLTNLMLRDKKVKNQTIRLILLKDIGNPFVLPFNEVDAINKSWEFILSEFGK